MEDKHFLINEISSFMDEFDPYECMDCMDQGADADDIYDIVSEMQFSSIQNFLIRTIKEEEEKNNKTIVQKGLHLLQNIILYKHAQPILRDE